jgi:hypothetical protein
MVHAAFIGAYYHQLKSREPQPEKAGVGGSTPSPATTFQKHLASLSISSCYRQLALFLHHSNAQ